MTGARTLATGRLARSPGDRRNLAETLAADDSEPTVEAGRRIADAGDRAKEAPAFRRSGAGIAVHGRLAASDRPQAASAAGPTSSISFNCAGMQIRCRS